MIKCSSPQDKPCGMCHCTRIEVKLFITTKKHGDCTSIAQYKSDFILERR